MGSRSTTRCSRSSYTIREKISSIAAVGVVLIVLGLAVIACQGGKVHEPRERRGHWSYSRDGKSEETTIPLPPVVGIAAVAGVVVLLMVWVRALAKTVTTANRVTTTDNDCCCHPRRSELQRAANYYTTSPLTWRFAQDILLLANEEFFGGPHRSDAV